MGCVNLSGKDHFAFCAVVLILSVLSAVCLSGCNLSSSNQPQNDLFRPQMVNATNKLWALRAHRYSQSALQFVIIRPERALLMAGTESQRLAFDSLAAAHQASIASLATTMAAKKLNSIGEMQTSPTFESRFEDQDLEQLALDVDQQEPELFAELGNWWQELRYGYQSGQTCQLPQNSAQIVHQLPTSDQQVGVSTEKVELQAQPVGSQLTAVVIGISSLNAPKTDQGSSVAVRGIDQAMSNYQEQPEVINRESIYF